MSKITYPYEIESRDGGRWVYKSNHVGELFIGGAPIDGAGVSCETMVATIEGQRDCDATYFWPDGSCVYHGPLRPTTKEVT